jgi:hypothetical protein
MDTARPPASSEDDEIREPLERRVRLFCIRSDERVRFAAECEAEVLVLIVSAIK